MGSTLENVFISFGSAAFGVVLTLWLPILLSNWRYSRRDDLLGLLGVYLAGCRRLRSMGH